jgi:hypothetical protein
MSATQIKRPIHGVGEVDVLRERIGRLVCERQALRTAGASRATLERNRIRLARSQSELTHALIACHLLV